MKLASDLIVHRIGRQIDLTRPGDRAVVDEDLVKKPRIQQGCEYTRQLFWPQLHGPR